MQRGGVIHSSELIKFELSDTIRQLWCRVEAYFTVTEFIKSCINQYKNRDYPIQYGNHDAEWRCISFDLVACELLCPRTNYLVDLSRFTNHGMLVFATCVIVQGLVPTTICSIQVTCGSFLSLSGTLMWHGRISRSSLSHCLLTSFIQLILHQVQCSMWMCRHWISHIWCKSHIFILA